MEILQTVHDHLPLVGMVEWVGAATVTDVVFVFLCSKPVFVLAALLVGLRAYRSSDGLEKRLPEEI